MPSTVPSRHRALVFEAVGAGFQVKTLPTPQAEAGSAIVQVLSAGVLSYHREIYDGSRHYNFPKPIVGGISAIDRIASLGPDAVALQPGQLVFVDCVMRARDDPDSLFMTAIHEGSNERSKKLMRDVWRDGVFAEYAKVPLENCIALDEARLCKDLGFTANDLMYLYILLVALGGSGTSKSSPGRRLSYAPGQEALVEVVCRLQWQWAPE